jgi:hypothetical protein
LFEHELAKSEEISDKQITELDHFIAILPQELRAG